MARCGKFGFEAYGRLLRGVLLVLTFTLLASPLAAQNQDPRALAEQAIRRLDLQTELPREPEPLRFQVPAQLIWLLAALGVGLLLYMFKDMLPALGFATRGDLAEEGEG